LSEQGKGEFTLNLDENSINIKAIALVSERSIPLIGFKGSKIDNYEEIIFTSDDYVEYEDIEDDEYVYEEVEYIEGEDSDEYEYEYEYLEYVDMDEDVSENENKKDEYEYESYEPTNNQSSQKSKINKSKQLNEETFRNNIKLNEEIEQIEEDINHKEVEQSTCRNLLMPRQIKKGLKMFKEVKPFVRDSIDNTRWWKIEITPMTMCGYTMPYLGYKYIELYYVQ